MLVFGRDAWLQHGEVFSLVFGTFARFAPTEARGGRLLLRPSGAGLLDDAPVSTSMMAFVLLLLATVLYDGLIGTGEWAELEGALRVSLPGSDETSGMVIKTVGLVAFWGLFLGAYLGICAVMSRVASGSPGPLEIARSFALTLVPIAIGYHVAHYLVFLLMQGQYIIPLALRPVRLRLESLRHRRLPRRHRRRRRALCLVCGRRGYRHRPCDGRLSRRTYGRLGVFEPHARSAGHAGAADRADGALHLHRPVHHRRADRREPRTAAPPPWRVEASHSGRRRASRAGDGRLQPSGPDRAPRLKLTYKVLGSAFHDQTKTTVADLLYAYMFAYRWGVRGAGERRTYDPSIDAATAPLRRHLVAVCARRHRHRPPSPSGSAMSTSYASSSPSRSIWTIAADDAEVERGGGAALEHAAWHVIALMEEAVTAAGRHSRRRGGAARRRRGSISSARTS